MTESEFNALVDDTLLVIEEALDEADSDMDSMMVGGVLTVHCERGAQIIFTRQAAVKQLWVATPDGGFHFDYDEQAKVWRRDSDNQPLLAFLTATFHQHAGELFEFDL
jgi:CyaY protein